MKYPYHPAISGSQEIRSAFRPSRRWFVAVVVFSAFVNMLMLTGPLYMLQVYDRVLNSRSIETLAVLTGLVAFLYLIMGVLDYARGRVLARVGLSFHNQLKKRVFYAVLDNSTRKQDNLGKTGNEDLESVQKFFTSPAPNALIDLPWTPVFLIGISVFHPWLGWLSLFGGSVLIGLAIINQFLLREPLANSFLATKDVNDFADIIRSESELVQSVGMNANAYKRWHEKNRAALSIQLTASDIAGFFSVITKSFRLFLQSAMLGLGAFLVLREELSAGAMIAGSILLGRALAPVELAISQWTVIERARLGSRHLHKLLDASRVRDPLTELPKPRARIDVQSLTVIPPGQTQASLRVLNFVIQPGEAVGVIGPSGAGKSTLARAITGTWNAAGGKVRLDRAALDQYDPDVLATYIGYLPQRVQLVDGTIAQNIARLAPNPDPHKVVAAAKIADIHELILKFPAGYDTFVSSAGGQLSGGQIQRIGLARAFYSEPVLLVLDEPNSNLDTKGVEALNLAIKRMKSQGKSVLIMAHRPAALQECSKILILKNGNLEAFGPKDEVLKQHVSNHKEIQNARRQGGVQ